MSFMKAGGLYRALTTIASPGGWIDLNSVFVVIDVAHACKPTCCDTWYVTVVDHEGLKKVRLSGRAILDDASAFERLF